MWCRRISAAERFTTAEIRLTCPLVTAEARVALAEDLPVMSVDFLLGNDLAVRRVWVQLSSADAVPDAEAAEGADSCCYSP